MLTVGIDSHNPVNIVAVLDYVLERRLESGALSAVDAAGCSSTSGKLAA